MESVSRSDHTIDDIINSMTDEEYKKALEFHKFLISITKCTKGILTIEREKFIKLAAALMECSPIEAFEIIRKMQQYGWIKDLNKDYVIVNINKEK
ncbi:hypothetical protein [Saccharolobus shibatae]|uniref:Transcriptional regulator, wHTH n=1 Tax=Saccharolobus shibatae TaxID=2286 RepID=A0A8F5BSB8_9CREN|nr:hypothetical protein [Saccharolobus shibatae]QXJ30328.1 Transcriptional regulator, wHTH [Saccharolobus shibatae]QXJ30430.1 Transcriptional regulator, wHTH [Saccharolobus shibatae]